MAAAVRLRQTPTPCWNSSERVGSAVVCKKKAERKRLGAHQRGGPAVLSAVEEEGRQRGRAGIKTGCDHLTDRGCDRGCGQSRESVARPFGFATCTSRQASQKERQEVQRPSKKSLDRLQPESVVGNIRLRQQLFGPAGKEGYVRAVKGYHASGKKMFRHPIRHIKRYVRQVEMELGRKDVHSS